MIVIMAPMECPRPIATGLSTAENQTASVPSRSLQQHGEGGMAGRGEHFGGHQVAVIHDAARPGTQVVEGEHDPAGISEMCGHAVGGVVPFEVQIEVAACAVPAG
jgi:hypothetical protein